MNDPLMRLPDCQRRSQLGIAALLGLLLTGPAVYAQSPIASAHLYQESGLLSAPAPIVTLGAGMSWSPASAGPSSVWMCEGFAASSAEWLTAEVYLALKKGGYTVAARVFYANYWGATYSVGDWIEAGLDPLTISCEIYVADLYGSVSASDSAQLPARAPVDVRVSSEDYWYFSPGHYLKHRIYQVWDNYDLAWNYANFPVTESYTTGDNGCNISVATGSGFTDSDGRFPDDYGTDANAPPGIPACQSRPSCRTDTRQTVVVAGVSFSHDVIWRCGNVDISDYSR